MKTISSLFLVVSVLSRFAGAETLPIQKVRFIEKNGPAANGKTTPPTLPPAVLKRFEQTAKTIDDLSADQVTDEQWQRATDEALKAFVKNLHIPHSAYHNPKEFRELMDSMRNKGFGGVGMEVAPTDLEKRTGAKVNPFPGSPSEAAGLKDGDVLEAVDGQDVTQMDLDAVVTLIRGKIGTPVALRVNRGGKTLKPDVKVVRQLFQPRHFFSEMIGTDVGYIYFDSFGEKGVTDTEFFQRLDALRGQGAKRLIVDLRFNPGGSVDTVGEITSEFLAKGTRIVTFKRQGQVTTYGEAETEGRYKRMPLVVMVNGHSASASEILSGACQDLKRCVVVGSRSYGKGSAQTIAPISDSFFSAPAAVRITSSKWFTPNDRSIQGQIDPKSDAEIKGTGGVVPDVVVDNTEDEDKAVQLHLRSRANGRPSTLADKQLDKAVETVRSLP